MLIFDDAMPRYAAYFFHFLDISEGFQAFAAIDAASSLGIFRCLDTAIAAFRCFAAASPCRCAYFFLPLFLLLFALIDYFDASSLCLPPLR